MFIPLAEFELSLVMDAQTSRLAELYICTCLLIEKFCMYDFQFTNYTHKFKELYR
jgi:hypothetical protein